MRIILYLTVVTILTNITFCNAQSSISFNSEYSIGELSSRAEYENCYNLQLDYNLRLKEWLTLKVGLYGQIENFYSGGTYSSFGDVIINGEVLENVNRTMRAEGKAKTILTTTGIQFDKFGFSTGLLAGIGLSSVSSTWRYRITQNGVDLNRQSFEEDYDTKPTWLLGIKLAYTYPVTERIGLGVTVSGNLLDSAERSVSSTKGTYMPEAYYDPELSREPAMNYGDSYIFSGILLEIKL